MRTLRKEGTVREDGTPILKDFYTLHKKSEVGRKEAGKNL